MNGYRTDALADLGYGILFVVAIGLMVILGIQTGITFGLGVFLAYTIHVGWKMSRLDPQWMTDEVVEAVEETVTEKVTQEVTESVEKQVGETVAESVNKEMSETVAKSIENEVSRTVDKTVAETVEETVSNEVTQVAEKVDEVNERVERRPRKDEVEESIDKTKEELEEAIGETKEKIEADDDKTEPDFKLPADSEK
ncbi:hypothetical protein HAPAU_38310 [Halalkalicoccus paucihalophilus]|uniref:Glutamate/valine-rich protein n=1 Tax=Halalkalicoccus paucihalophilus TaxID=1008153 RepID=A0A151A8D1_9EURY|nr:hypothetical protein [Halalkalicoccus paucihalophilus]KYH23752.1 hypothetical protein HAPAU_38310 [Halalkalicoccus paucihalophilus]